MPKLAVNLDYAGEIATPEEEQPRADVLDLRCLSRRFLFARNYCLLSGILGELIIAAVKRKQLALREKGLVRLGLCCLIARVTDGSQLIPALLSQVQFAGMISDERVIESLVVAYSPDTAKNQTLRQSSVIWKTTKKCHVARYRVRQSTTETHGVHLDFVEDKDTLKALFKDDVSSASQLVLRGRQKGVLSSLGMGVPPRRVDDDKIRTLKLLVHNVFTRQTIRDVSASNAPIRFHALISKECADMLTWFSEEEYSGSSSLMCCLRLWTMGRRWECQRRGDGSGGGYAGAGGRRSESVMTETTETTVSTSSVADDGSVGSGRGKGKATSTKRRRVSGSDEDASEAGCWFLRRQYLLFIGCVRVFESETHALGLAGTFRFLHDVG
ncbi:hypothetical protein OG21DRAFT_1525854 [Imleria badia]|nr:hypothetical protein OG21DRAFT_1525854 [Imleria badia]